MIVGLISDTHGLLRPEATDALRGSDLILHAGDVGEPRIVEELRALAPIHAVLGNVDSGDWLPQRMILEIEKARVLLLHNVAESGDTDGLDAIVFGHSHKPLVDLREGVLFVNPGSAGRRRFKLPITVGRLRVTGRSVSAEIIPIVD